MRGPKSPSGRLDLLRPITAAQGLAQLIRIGINASFPSSSESSKKAKVSTRAHVNHRAASASEPSHDSLKGNGKSDHPDEGISALRDSHNHIVITAVPRSLSPCFLHNAEKASPLPLL